MRSHVRATISAPTAATLNGASTYTGAYWVRPDMRSKGLSAVLPKLMRYMALTTWNSPVEFSLGRNQFLRPDVAETYGFEHIEPSFEFFIDDKLIWDGVLLWSTRDELISQLENILAMREKSQLSVNLGRGHDKRSASA
jgi:hypothetical protein